jgi:hypothetical protein
MNAQEALAELSARGERSGNTFDDSMDAYFSWVVEDGILTVQHLPCPWDDARNRNVEGDVEGFRFTLVPVEG